MRTIRKQTLLRAGAALVPAILALTLLAACLPVRTEITQLTAEDLDSTDPREALVLEEMEDGESTWGTVSRVCRTGLLGAEETYYLVPYLRTQVRDVGTAGSSDWVLEPGLLVLAWQGGQPAEPDRATLEASLLRAEADENTLFFAQQSNLLEQELPSLTWKEAGEEGLSHFIMLSAATKNSALEENARCLCRTEWTGAWRLEMGWGKSVEMAFSLASDAPYVGNVS